ncbi:hypothetical protein [Pseudomonas triticifolii]|uniref:Uncharacterized protein n=1 Tax=Pseudomonas triticifolii TaxID=2762592 RepID=A0ABR7BCF0_9PSED|nr:hypothetical protein [Pseudomonas triticifolii]MBC3954849.1 hypothetical protein [Pseudomonas triticifolii]
MKKLLPVALLFVSVASVAADFSVTTTRTPTSIMGPGHSAFTRHQLRLSEYARGAAMNSRLRGISWSATIFPESTGEEAKICYRRDGVNETACRAITPGERDSTDAFNHLGFSYATDVLIKHKAANGPWKSNPVGPESVTFHLTY